MRPFGWQKWKSLYWGFKKSKLRSIERWGLVYLHSTYTLDKLAYSVAQLLGKNGKHCEVSLESIWIDGTPQAEAKALSGCSIKCELADLLFILEERDQTNLFTLETGLLIQGKATPRYNKLTSGSSTKKERQLLEGMDRSQPIILYRGTGTAQNSIIGTYKLAGIPFGLNDCSRYLLMPKSAAWDFPFFEDYAPFQVGWPKARVSPYLQSPKSIVEAIQQMVLLGNIGKKIIDPSKCEWSRLVNDLRGNYSSTQMIGYGGQPRVNHSTTMISFVSALYMSNGPVRKYPPDYPPTGSAERSNTEENTPPSISVIKITIRHLDTDSLIDQRKNA